MCELALDGVMAGYDYDQPQVVGCYCVIRNVLKMQSKYDKALVHHHKNLEIQIRVFGCNHLEVAMSSNNSNILYT